MSILDRIGLLLRSNINDLLNKAEDPEKILNQLLIDMRDQFIEAKRQVAVAIADEKRLEARYISETRQAEEWEKKAMLALTASDETLAQEALGRKAGHDQLAVQWKVQHEAQRAAALQLRQALLQLNDKIGEAKRRKDLLVARAKRAEAQKTIHNTMAGLNKSDSFDAFGRMVDKVEQMEAEAAAGASLAAEVSGADLEDKFRKLEQERNSSAALLALKAKMGLLPDGTAQVQAPLTLEHAEELDVPDIGEISVADKVPAAAVA